MALFKRKVKPVAADKPAEAAQTRAAKAANNSTASAATGAASDAPGAPGAPGADTAAPEVGGRQGPEPTRYGDWENKGRCVDF